MRKDRKKNRIKVFMADFRRRADNDRAGGGSVPDGTGQEPGFASSAAPHALGFKKRRRFLQPGPCFQVGHDKRLQAFGRGAHADGVGFHDAEVGTHVGCQVGFVDDEQVAFGDTGPPLRRMFSPVATSIT